MFSGQTSRRRCLSAKRVCGGLRRKRGTVDACELERLHHHYLSFHPSLLPLSFSNCVSLGHLPLTLGLSGSLLYPLVNRKHIKRSHTHTHIHAHTILQQHGAESGFYLRSFVFQVVISSRCCSSANHKSHKPMTVIISPSGKTTSRARGRRTEMCVCVMWYVRW